MADPTETASERVARIVPATSPRVVGIGMRDKTTGRGTIGAAKRFACGAMPKIAEVGKFYPLRENTCAMPRARRMCTLATTHRGVRSLRIERVGRAQACQCASVTGHVAAEGRDGGREAAPNERCVRSSVLDVIGEREWRRGARSWTRDRQRPLDRSRSLPVLHPGRRRSRCRARPQERVTECCVSCCA
jgi:hypothetical protein